MKRILRGASLAGLAGLAALNIGCDPVPASSDTGGSDSCPVGDGYEHASTTKLYINQLIVDEHLLAAQFNATATYDGEPAACFSDDDQQGTLVFEVAGEPYARITVGSSQEGNNTFTGTEGTLQVELFGETTPVTFAKSDFYSGTWVVESIQPFVVDLYGEAMTSDLRSLSLSFRAEFGP